MPLLCEFPLWLTVSRELIFDHGFIIAATLTSFSGTLLKATMEEVGGGVRGRPAADAHPERLLASFFPVNNPVLSTQSLRRDDVTALHPK